LFKGLKNDNGLQEYGNRKKFSLLPISMEASLSCFESGYQRLDIGQEKKFAQGVFLLVATRDRDRDYYSCLLHWSGATREISTEQFRLKKQKIENPKSSKEK